MRDILILDCYEIKCPLVLLYVFIELCNAFKERLYNVKIINNISDITNNSIVFLGDIINTSTPANLLNIQSPEAIYIGWGGWHKYDVSVLKYFIYTHENRLNPEILSNKIKISCPLLLRASDNPNLIGKYKRDIKRDYCYMGWKYCENLVPSSIFSGIYHGVTDHKLFLNYSNRKKIYLSSTFALGFQSNENIINKHVSQRIFEGLAYGCLVLSNSMPACEQTNNIVIFINSKKDLEDKMKYYLNNPDLIIKKQEEGYNFCKKYGTNHYAIDKFIHTINENYNNII
jgi:hypothetical protein